ncbi:MarR family transcriptional regulator [Rhodococcus sp. BP-252]|uniref:MarR family transcriptional regulator n=1 Tax=Rhodococcoides kyotonense TaxID=398843 RepID=A0A177YC40_9NOCA|nr:MULTISPECIES: MarR family transcriptional regulator [Rhodococcus]MBY6412939.1 MarR family transcriptional regulator [Rhodococcus sp. BP-320]MBY6419459.1 MarR family transcriptional regulator [Rhodococcus sp. BP-321]MBY6423867.1 MarR family transcriptional regulator [Rhodococcus sp. BP-324]MBY6429123.1 MarR family transcriptional regulator [Rhodococcus sp. BP-323]MBY6432861.1 MarR family transcriptional regulator [Rhodococcus sp. BP-322]
METTIDATGEAPAETAWERYMKPEMWSSWAPQIMGVDYAESRLRPETFGKVRGPLGFPVDFEILDVDEPGRTWTWKAWFVHRSLGLTLTHGVASTTNGTRTWLTVRGPSAFVLPYVPIAKFALMQLVRK